MMSPRLLTHTLIIVFISNMLDPNYNYKEQYDYWLGVNTYFLLAQRVPLQDRVNSNSDIHWFIKHFALWCL